MRDRSRIALRSIRATNLPMCQAISLSNATRAGPGLPAIQHLAEFTDGGGRSFVGVGGDGGAKPIRLGVAARSASLGTPFSGLEIAREIAGRIRDPEQHDQCDDTLHHWLRPFSQDFCAAIEARSRLDRAQTGARLIPQGRANCRVTPCRTVVHIIFPRGSRCSHAVSHEPNSTATKPAGLSCLSTWREERRRCCCALWLRPKSAWPPSQPGMNGTNLALARPDQPAS